MSTSPESTPAPEAPKPAALLLEVITKNEIAGPDLIMLQGSFSPMLAEVERWAAIAKGIKITSATQTREMKLARETRLGLRQLRVDANKKRESLKATALRYGRAVDGAYAIVEFITKETEAHLLEQEKFAERIEEQRVAALKAEREEKLKPYGVDVSLYQLGLMPQEAFDSLLEGQRLAAEAKEKERRRVEQERLEAENKRLIEEKRVRDENERLRKEKADREEADRQKAEADRVAKDKAAQEAQAAAYARATRKAEREKVLNPFLFDFTFTPLADMPEEEFAALVIKVKADFEANAKREAEAQVAREAHEKALAEERRKSDELLAAQRAETERVAKEAADREAATKAQRDADAAKAAAEQAERDRVARAEKEAADAKAAEDRRAREQAEKELQAARDAEAKRLADQEAEQKRAAGASDKEKIEAFRVALASVSLASMSTPEAEQLAATIVAQQRKFNDWLIAKIATL